MKNRIGLFMLLAGCLRLYAQPVGVDNGCCTVAVNMLGVLSLNPTLEIEYSLSSSWSLAATAWYEIRDVRDRWGQMRLSWYPVGTVQNRWGVSLTGGVHRAWPEKSPAGTESADTSPTAGLLVHYSWRLGQSRKTFINLTMGGKKCLADRQEDSALRSGYVEGRMHIGRMF